MNMAQEFPKGKNTSRFRKRLNAYGQQEYPRSLELMAVRMPAGTLNSPLQAAGNAQVVRPSWSGEEEGGKAAPAPALLQPPSEVPVAKG